MRQGSASRTVTEVKVEPRSKAIIPAGAAQIGIRIGNHITDHGSTGYGGVPLGAGRGFKAPRDVGVTVHRGGSQGKR